MRYYICGTTLLYVLCGSSIPAYSASLEITPFRTANRSPLVQIFGLPEPESGTITAQGAISTGIMVDIANNYATESSSSEQLVLDGELYRTTLSFRYGVGDRFEAGVDIPVVGNGGGGFDSFIEGWHDFFNLPQGGREAAPRNRLLYSYSKDGREKLHLDSADTGIGDIRLIGGYQLYAPEKPGRFAASLKGSLKLPTGNSTMLQGSGSYDTALWIDAAQTFNCGIGDYSLFGSGGGMIMTKGDVLSDQQSGLAWFGTAGAGLVPAEWIALIVQLSGHSPFYEKSDLEELSGISLQIHTGGTLRLPGAFLMDIAVSEDIAVDTAPDVTLHMAIRRLF